MLLFEIDNDILWKQGRFNFFFTFNARNDEIDVMANSVFFYKRENCIYTEWEAVKQTGFTESNIDTNNLYMAA